MEGERNKGRIDRSVMGEQMRGQYREGKAQGGRNRGQYREVLKKGRNEGLCIKSKTGGSIGRGKTV